MALTDTQKSELFKAIATDPKARQDYIVSRAAVIEPLIRKQNQVRDLFTVENLAQGAQPTYQIGAKEVQTAWIASQVNSAPRRHTQGDEVYVNTFPIHARADMSLDQIYDGRFPVSQENSFWVAEQLKELENYIGWNLIKAAAADATFDSAHSIEITSGTAPDLTTGKGFFSKQLLASMQLAMDISRRNLTDIYMSPRTMFDLFNYWTSPISGGGNYMPEATRERIMSQGAPASGAQDTEYTFTMWGIRFHKVYDASVIGDAAVYGFDLSGARGTKFGVMPIRQGLVTYEDPNAILNYHVGYFARERFGFAVLDSTCLVKGIITRA